MDHTDPKRPPRFNIKARVNHVTSLPGMPETAYRLIQLRNKARPESRELSDIVGRDPAIAAQILRYANSPFFGFQGRIESIEQAVVRVLGYESVMNIAMGIAMMGSFHIRDPHLLDLHRLWTRAVYAAALSQAISRHAESDRPLKPGLAYLGGLLQDIGYLVLGHHFPKEFFWLRKIIPNHPHMREEEIETQVLGINHMEIGYNLMRNWTLPEEVTTAIRHHHDYAYTGDHAAYAHVVCIANHLLSRYDEDQDRGTDLPEKLLAGLSLDEEKLKEIYEHVLSGRDDLDHMARQLAA